MTESDIAAFAELIQQNYGRAAFAEASRRARRAAQSGDHRNAGAWHAIADRIAQADASAPLAATAQDRVLPAL